MSGAFDPDVERALELMRTANRPRFETLTVAEARLLYRAGRETVNLLPVEVAAVEELQLAGRPARCYQPASGPSAATIMFVHGGGYTIGDLDTHDSICRLLAIEAGLDLIALDYRLAPEHPFPGAFDDCLAAYCELSQHGRPIALAGDSAGGALVASVALAARDEGLPAPIAAALFYPVADLGVEATSYSEAMNVPISAETMRWFWRHYLPEGPNSDWRASPIRGDLSALPPVFIATAGHDPLRDEGKALVQAIRAAGGRVIHRDLPGQVHGYLTLGRLVREAGQSLAAAGAFLRSEASSAMSPE